MALIFHLIAPKEWEAVLNKSHYAPASLATEGFIHFSTKEQVLRTAKRFFGEQEEMVVLEVSEKQVKPQLKWEESDGVLFPHVYAKIPLEAISNSRLIWKNKAGEWQWD